VREEIHFILQHISFGSKKKRERKYNKMLRHLKYGIGEGPIPLFSELS